MKRQIKHEADQGNNDLQNKKIKLKIVSSWDWQKKKKKTQVITGQNKLVQPFGKQQGNIFDKVIPRQGIYSIRNSYK